MCLSPRFTSVPAHLLHVVWTVTTVYGMKILMIEGERETVRGRERAQCGMNGCSAMLLLQSYYNENSTFLRNPLAYFVSEPM